jgi:hypothetical protein
MNLSLLGRYSVICVWQLLTAEIYNGFEENVNDIFF